MTRDERDLERIVGAMREVPDEQATMERVWRKVQAPRRRAFPAGLARAAAAAAIIAVAAAAVYLGRGPATQHGPAYVETKDPVTGRVETREVGFGRVIEPQADGRIVVKGIAQIVMLARGTLMLTPGDSSLRVDLHRGSSLFTVEKLRPGYVFSVVTPHAEVRVHGTVFTVDVSEVRTEVLVREGVVSCIAGGVEETVAAGGACTRSRAGAASGTRVPGGGEAGAEKTSDTAPVVRSAAATAAKGGRGNGRRSPEKQDAAASYADEARELLAGRRYAEAVEKLAAAYDRSGSPDEREDLLFKRGQVLLLNLGRHREAAATFMKYVDEYPAGTYVEEATYHVAEAYGKIDDLERAVQWFDRFVVLSRDAGRKAAAQYNAGALALRLTGDCAQAVKRFDAALVSAPPDIEKKALAGAITCRIKLREREGLPGLVERYRAAVPGDPLLETAAEFLKAK